MGLSFHAARFCGSETGRKRERTERGSGGH
jgi:hypothetical protein